jgi:tRNA threonylcarbamoyladenosine biosynthesis protein TsaB
MLLVALDTTTRAGSCALVRDGVPVAVVTGAADRPHAVRLPGDILDLLSAHQLTLADVDGFAVASGPGSFTGLRIGIAAIQGLAFATGKPAVGVPTLDALARAAAGQGVAAGETIGVWMDAQRGEVFAARYRVVPAGDAGAAAVEAAGEAVSMDPRSVAAQWRADGLTAAVLVGDGALRYREAVAAAGDLAWRVIEPTPPLAGTLGVMAAEALAGGGTFLPHAIAPVYVRRSDAELARDRRQGGA